MSIDLFDTRTMLPVLEQMYPPKTFLLDTFFSQVETSESEYVDIDIEKGKRRLAAFVRPTSQAKMVERRGFTTKSFKPPYIKMKMVTSAADILKRMQGNTIYQGGSSPAERAAMQLGKDLAELRDMVIRREEWMAAQALDSGVIAIESDEYSAEIDFSMDADHIVSLGAGDRWNESTSDPLGDLRTWARLIAKDSGLMPDVVVMGSSALDAFLSNDEVRAVLDNRRIQMGEIIPQDLPSGAFYVGQIKGLYGVDLYGYDEWYLDASDVLQPMIPVKKVWMGSTKARSARHYGAIRDLKAGGNFAVPYFPKSWEVEDPSAQILMVQSAPIVAPHQIDAFVSAQVLA